MSTAVKVTALPPCDFCLLAGVLKRGETPRGVYDFKTRSGSWANGCHEHYHEHRMFTELGTGKGQKLFIEGAPHNPPPKPAHLERLQDALREHGTLEAAIDANEDLI